MKVTEAMEKLNQMAEQTKELYQSNWTLRNGVHYHDKIDSIVTEAAQEFERHPKTSHILCDNIFSRHEDRMKIFQQAKKIARAAKINS